MSSWYILISGGRGGRRGREGKGTGGKEKKKKKKKRKKKTESDIPNSRSGFFNERGIMYIYVYIWYNTSFTRLQNIDIAHLWSLSISLPPLPSPPGWVD